MRMVYSDYETEAARMRPGDVLVTGFPRAPLPIHAALIYAPNPPVVVEGWFSGVQTLPLKQILDERLTLTPRRSRRMWWFPLSENITEVQRSEMIAWASAQIGKQYDWSAALRSIWDVQGEGPGDRSYAPDDDDRLMCIEVVVGALRAAGIVSDVNPAEMTAIEVAKLPIYAETYYQIFGTQHEIIQ